MRVDANAKLGPACRLAPGRKIDEGRSVDSRRPEEESRRRPRRIGGGIAGSKLMRRSAQAASGYRTARVGHGVSRGVRAPTSRRGSARFEKRRAGRGWSPARLATRIRRSRRCSSGTGSHAGQWRGARGAQPLRSRPAPAICCTWMSAAIRASACRTPRHRRSLPRDRHWMKPATRVGDDYAHAIVDDHSTPGLRRTARRRTRDHRHRLRRARPASSPATALPPAADDRQRVHLRQNRPLRQLLAACDIGHLPRSPTGRAPTARSSASTNDGPRMGSRPQLPHQRAPSQPRENRPRARQPP